MSADVRPESERRTPEGFVATVIATLASCVPTLLSLSERGLLIAFSVFAAGALICVLLIVPNEGMKGLPTKLLFVCFLIFAAVFMAAREYVADRGGEDGRGGDNFISPAERAYVRVRVSRDLNLNNSGDPLEPAVPGIPVTVRTADGESIWPNSTGITNSYAVQVGDRIAITACGATQEMTIPHEHNSPGNPMVIAFHLASDVIERCLPK